MREAAITSKSKYLIISMALLAQLMLSALFSIASLGAFATAVSSPVRNEDTSEEFATIQAAIDDSDTDNGDIIFVQQGNTFEENLVINKELTIRSNNKWNTTLITQGAYNGVDITASNVTLEGFKILLTDSNDTTAWHVKISGQSNIVLRDVVMYGPGKNAGYTGNNATNPGISGLDINSSQNVTLERVTVEKYTKNGIAVTAKQTASSTPAQNISFTDVIVRNNGQSAGWAGIAFYTTSSQFQSADINEVTFSGSNLIAWNPMGIFFEGVTGRSTLGNSPVDLSTVGFQNNIVAAIVNAQAADVEAVGAEFNGLNGVNALSSELDSIESGIIHDCEASPYLTGLCDSDDLPAEAGSVNYAVDTEAPSKVTGVTVIQSGDNLGCYPYVNSRTIRVDWNDVPESDLAYYRYQADADKAAPYDFTTTVFGSSERTGEIRDADGTYHYRVQAVDAVGNVGEWSDWCGVTLDREAPDAANVSPFDGAVVNGVSITQQWSSTASDVDYFEYQSFNDAAATSLRWSQSYSSTSKTAINIGEAEYWWRVRAVDMAGNKSEWTDVWKITVDNTAPLSLFTNPGDSDTVNGLVDIRGTVEDNNPLRYYLRIENSSGGVVYSKVFNDPSIFTDQSLYSWDTTGVVDGDYILFLESRDMAGNKDGSRTALDTSVDRIDVVVDNTAPIVDFAGLTTLDTTPELTGDAGDAVSVDVEVNGVTYTDASPSGTWTVNVDALAGLSPESTYDVSITAEDAVGNSETTLFSASLVIEAPAVLGASTTTGSGNNSNQVPVKNVAIGNSSDSNEVASSTGSGGTGGEPFVAQAQPTSTNNDGEEDDSEEESDEGAEVLQSTTDIENSEEGTDDEATEDGCFKIFGICWYWYGIPALVLILGYGYYISQKEEQN